MNNSAQDILRHTFGYEDFRGNQKDIIDCVCEGGNPLVVMPTGGGKSLCYQIPALLLDGVAVVVSPLIALMHDQVTALREYGVSAGYLNSSLAYEDVQRIEQALFNGSIKLLYIAPERLLLARTIELLKRLNISLFAIDEAHCVAQWGHDFRADYLRLDMLAQEFPHVPRMALTATADRKTQIEIVQRLGLNENAMFVSGFDRPNIHYTIEQKSKARQQLLKRLKEFSGQVGIIYCMSRKKVESTAAWLEARGINALPYHAGMDSSIRKIYQDKFLREDNIVMVATIAFGMGIDKPNVRFVIHLDMPKSVEAYYQETGRAGRDGNASHAILFYGMEDVVKLGQMTSNSEGSEQFKLQERQRINSMLGLCETIACRRQVLLRYFGEDSPDRCDNCDNCDSPPEQWDASVEVQKALSCVYRTEQIFGAAHVIDVLRGASTEKIRQFKHDQLSTYGIGKDISQESWRSIFRQLIVMGYLVVDDRGYGSLRLSESSRPILRGEKQILLHKNTESYTRNNSRSSSKRNTDDVAQSDMPLWEALRRCRKDLADEYGVPPFVVFHDSVLKDMILHRPENEFELLSISGVGDSKLEKYGDAFLQVLEQFSDA